LTLRGVRCSQTYDLSCVLCLVIVNILIYDWFVIGMIFVLVNRFLDVMVSSCKIQSVFLVCVFDFTKFTHTLSCTRANSSSWICAYYWTSKNNSSFCISVICLLLEILSLF
jgi:hypothetical protein